MPRSTDQVLRRYLERYAEHVVLPEPPADLAEHPCIVIPVFDEAEDCLERVVRNLGEPVCLICVVNAPDDAGTAALRANHRLLRRHGVDQPVCWRRLQCAQHAPAHPILFIDRTSQPLPRRQGVGLARKIGFDSAVALYHSGALQSPWVHSTDADAVLPANYGRTESYPESGVVLFPFQHRNFDESLGDVENASAYERHLAHYQAGLMYARSPYAFTALGSALACHAKTYAAVRGFPKRNAGEDFHYVAKIAKIAPVSHLSGPVIELSARFSNRVPFGTGPKLLEMREQDEWRTYHPEVFVGLRTLLTTISRAEPNSTLQLNDWVAACTRLLGLEQQYASLARQYTTKHTLRRALHVWFDALKTLRFVHLAQAHWPDLPMNQALDAAPWREDFSNTYTLVPIY